MKILCIGDLHLSHTRLELCKKVLNWIELITKKEGVDALVYLGDEHDSHSVIRAECNSIWASHLAEQLKLQIPLYWLLGNHAQFKPTDATYNALQPFLGWSSKYLHPITNPCEIDGFGFVPYLNSASWKESVENFKSKIIFTHNTFVGADYGFKISTDGVELSEISQNFIISGHIHKRQILQTSGSSNSKVIYPGTPYAWSANDVDQPKGLMILDADCLETSFIESPFPLWKKFNVDLTKDFRISVPSRVSSNDHLLIKLVGLRSDIKAFIASDSATDLRSKYSSVSFSTEFLDSAKSQSNAASIKTSSLRESVQIYMKSIYKGSISSELVEKEVLKALGEVS
jgi:predicted phosphodiesterase